MNVKNTSRGPLWFDGCGALAPGERGRAIDNDHTQAQIQAGNAVEIVAKKTTKAPAKPDETKE